MIRLLKLFYSHSFTVIQDILGGRKPHLWAAAAALVER